jgi:hypothetical protein
VTRDFFAAHTVRELEQQSDYWLEQQGRLTEPMRYDPATDHYVPVTWDEAFTLVGRELNALDDPNEAEFYTSGRTSNEAPFSQNSNELVCRESGHAQPGQSKPSGWFIASSALVPLISTLCSRSALAVACRAPQPPAGAS